MADPVLQQIAETAKAALASVDEASVTFTRGDDTGWTVASTGELASALDEAQYATGNGPCMDASTAGEVLIIEDFHTETRWPDYVAKAGQTAGRSSLSIPMPVQSSVLAALNLYSVRPGAFGPADIPAAKGVAGLGAVTVTQLALQETAEMHAAQLQEAMRSRAVIEQAKGIIMATTRCDPERAFELLRAQSQTENRKLREIAQELVGRQST
jgi:GAF domain-containing protein